MPSVSDYWSVNNLTVDTVCTMYVVVQTLLKSQEQYSVSF